LKFGHKEILNIWIQNFRSNSKWILSTNSFAHIPQFYTIWTKRSAPAQEQKGVVQGFTKFLLALVKKKIVCYHAVNDVALNLQAPSE